MQEILNIFAIRECVHYILITLGGIKYLLKWVLPRYVKEARGDRRKTDGKKEGKERKRSKDGGNVQGEKMRQKDIRENLDTIRYTLIVATRAKQARVLPKFLFRNSHATKTLNTLQTN